MSAEEVRALMETETWLSPEQALNLGLATSMVADRSVPVAQAAKRTIMQRVLATPVQTATNPPVEPKPAVESKPAAKPEPDNPINPIMKLFL